MRFAIVSTLILAPLALAAAVPKAEEIKARQNSPLSTIPLDVTCVQGCLIGVNSCAPTGDDLASLLGLITWYVFNMFSLHLILETQVISMHSSFYLIL